MQVAYTRLPMVTEAGWEAISLPPPMSQRPSSHPRSLHCLHPLLWCLSTSWFSWSSLQCSFPQLHLTPPLLLPQLLMSLPLLFLIFHPASHPTSTLSSHQLPLAPPFLAASRGLQILLSSTRSTIQRYYLEQRKKETSGCFVWSKVFLDKCIANRTIGQSLRVDFPKSKTNQYNQNDEKQGRENSHLLAALLTTVYWLL